MAEYTSASCQYPILNPLAHFFSHLRKVLKQLMICPRDNLQVFILGRGLSCQLMNGIHVHTSFVFSHQNLEGNPNRAKRAMNLASSFQKGRNHSQSRIDRSGFLNEGIIATRLGPCLVSKGQIKGRKDICTRHFEHREK